MQCSIVDTPILMETFPKYRAAFDRPPGKTLHIVPTLHDLAQARLVPSWPAQINEARSTFPRAQETLGFEDHEKACVPVALRRGIVVRKGVHMSVVETARVVLENLKGLCVSDRNVTLKCSGPLKDTLDHGIALIACSENIG